MKTRTKLLLLYIEANDFELREKTRGLGSPFARWLCLVLVDALISLLPYLIIFLKGPS